MKCPSLGTLEFVEPGNRHTNMTCECYGSVHRAMRWRLVEAAGGLVLHPQGHDLCGWQGYAVANSCLCSAEEYEAVVLRTHLIPRLCETVLREGAVASD
eukprot:1741008-Amphidinium_carterae.1